MQIESELEIVNLNKQPHHRDKIRELLTKNGLMPSHQLDITSIFKDSVIATLREGGDVAYVIASKWDDHVHINYLVSTGGGLGSKLMFAFIDEMEMDMELVIRKSHIDFLTSYYGNLGFVPTTGLTMVLEY